MCSHLSGTGEFTIESFSTIRTAIEDGNHPPLPQGMKFDPTSVMALFLIEEQIKLLFIQKADVPGYLWANQMAFPGGHQDEEDVDSRQTAIRELEEEMGIRSSNVEVIGSLGHFQTLNNKDIEAWTGIWNRKDTIKVDETEISRVFKIPLSHLVAVHIESRYHEGPVDIMKLIYPFEDVQIWGATAKIVCHLINSILSVEHQTRNYKRYSR